MLPPGFDEAIHHVKSPGPWHANAPKEERKATDDRTNGQPNIM